MRAGRRRRSRGRAWRRSRSRRRKGWRSSTARRACSRSGSSPPARAERLARTADVVAAMTIEAALGTDAPFDERLQRLRPHPGQNASASNLRRLLAGSPILASHRDSHHLVQDAYSLRCAPQVHGATRDALDLRHRGAAASRRAASATTRSCCRARAMPTTRSAPVATSTASRSRWRWTRVATALVSLASISERRLYRLLDPKQNNDLPAFLVHGSGLNSGFMLVQYTAASLVSESQVARAPRIGRLDPVERRARRTTSAWA